jgi:membrane-bound lytic murein transglycosylase B
VGVGANLARASLVLHAYHSSFAISAVTAAMLRTVLYLIAAGMMLAGVTSFAAENALRPEMEAFVEHMQAKHGYDAASLRKSLQQVQPRPSIIKAMTAPSTSRPWFEYRRRIVEPVRIENGVRFWRENRAALEKASREYGVPEELIAATIGVETLYGRNMGTLKVLDALATLAFDYPPRAEFFKGELEEYLLLTREAGLNPANMRGSYAGAIGIPQFLPSSYRKYAVDFDGDGRRDIVDSAADAIGSIANYYRSYGWTKGAPVVISAEPGDADLGPILEGGIRPHITVAELRKRGVVVPASVDENAEATVFYVQTEAGPKLLLGLNNFYVITRYNRSINYAMAVHELATELRAAMRAR